REVRRWHPKSADDSDPVRALAAYADHLERVAEGTQGGRVHHHLASFGMVLGPRQAVHERSSEHVDQLDGRVSDHEAPRPAGSYGHLHAELDSRAGRSDDRAYTSPRSLHREATIDA